MEIKWWLFVVPANDNAGGDGKRAVAQTYVYGRH